MRALQWVFLEAGFVARAQIVCPRTQRVNEAFNSATSNRPLPQLRVFCPEIGAPVIGDR